jgi:O-antigen/teichoic acid export membrane protein
MTGSDARFRRLHPQLAVGHFRKSRERESARSFSHAPIPLAKFRPVAYLHRILGTLRSESHSGRRWRAIGLSAATSAGERVITGVCGLIQIPIALAFLGREAFGLWMTLTSLVTVMSIADFGLGIGLQNRIAHAYGKDDSADAQRVAATGILSLAGIGAAVFVIALPVCFAVNWASVFHLHEPDVARSTGAALAILVSAFCAGFPLAGAERVSAGFQLGWLTSLKASFTSVTTLVLVVAAVWLKFGLLWFLAVVVVPPVLANFLLLIVLHRRLGWSLRLFSLFDRSLAASLFRKNWLFILPQIGGTILAFAPPLLISGMLGVSALTPYNLVQRLLNIFGQAQGMMVGPLWPAYTEAIARGDVDWVRAAFRKSLAVSFVFAVLPILSFIAWGKWALHFWTRQPVESFDFMLIASLSVWTAVLVFMQCIALLLNALGQVKGQSTYGLGSLLIALAIMPPFISRFGSPGAPLSLLFGFAIVSLPLALWEAFYHLRKFNQTPRSDPAR